MRSGGCTIQQALTSEAASVVKQAVVLAKRRGHAQVTPLHVANALLASPSGLLRTACLQSQTQSQSHPLRCKALELCFNVALNRLPTSSSSSSSFSTTPMLLGHHHHHLQPQPQHQHPSISNALVAAFKRAQAHQRRGSIVENHHHQQQQQQQQPLLSTKIDLEQLIISILDDPSVSRVMKEAGFASTQVKTNVEQAIISLDLMCTTSQNPSPSSKSIENNNNNHIFLQSGGLSKPKDEDVMSVVESLMNKRRKSIVIVGECIASLEGVIKGVMDKVDNINNRDCSSTNDQSLKEIKLISVPLSTFANITRQQVDQRIGELTCHMKSLVLTKGVVLYLGDLKWISDNYRANSSSRSGLFGYYYYCPVEHIVMELGRLVCSNNIGENGKKIWLVGIATFQTYMRCRNGHNSLESIWGLHPITVPAGSLGLSLNYDGDTQLQLRSKAYENGYCGMILDDHEKQLTCCVDCSSKFKIEALSLQQNNANPNNIESSSLPSWLKDERQRLNNTNIHHQKGESVEQLCKKWNSICNSSHKTFERSLTFPTSTLSLTSRFLDPKVDTPLNNSRFLDPEVDTPLNNSRFLDPEVDTWRRRGRGTGENNDDDHDDDVTATCEPISLRIYIPEHNDNRNTFSSSDDQNMEMEYNYDIPMFKEFNLENMNILYNKLEEKVSWQKEAIKEISRTILECRSGIIKRNYKGGEEVKQETWLSFLGNDVQAKVKVARELAKVVFGSYSRFTSITLTNFKRFEEVCSNPRRVFFLELDVEQVDYCAQIWIKKAIERGKIASSSGEEVSLSDAIIILSFNNFDGLDNEDIMKGANNPKMEETNESVIRTPSNCVSLDLNISIHNHETSSCVDDIRLLECVDRCIMFRRTS